MQACLNGLVILHSIKHSYSQNLKRLKESKTLFKSKGSQLCSWKMEKCKRTKSNRFFGYRKLIASGRKIFIYIPVTESAIYTPISHKLFFLNYVLYMLFATYEYDLLVQVYLVLYDYIEAPSPNTLFGFLRVQLYRMYSYMRLDLNSV